MPTPKARQRVLVLLNRIARAHAIAQTSAEDLYEAVQGWGEVRLPAGGLANFLGSPADDPADLFTRPIVNLCVQSAVNAVRRRHQEPDAPEA